MFLLFCQICVFSNYSSFLGEQGVLFSISFARQILEAMQLRVFLVYQVVLHNNLMSWFVQVQLKKIVDNGFSVVTFLQLILLQLLYINFFKEQIYRLVLQQMQLFPIQVTCNCKAAGHEIYFVFFNRDIQLFEMFVFIIRIIWILSNN